MALVIFDIETGPLPLEQVLATAEPFPAYQQPGEFDRAAVKLGNLKDQQKIAEKIQAAAEAHAKMVAESRSKWEAEKAAYEAGLMDKAALSAITGQVLAVGLWNPDRTDEPAVMMQGEQPGRDGVLSEAQLLSRIWQLWAKSQSGDAVSQWIGWNICGFDLPFLVQRSWVLGVQVPPDVQRDGRYWHPGFIDLMTRWACGAYGKWAKLDLVCRALGLEGKGAVTIPGQGGEGEQVVDGSMFARLWAEDRAKAVEYLKNDIVQTYDVAKKLRVA